MKAELKREVEALKLPPPSPVRAGPCPRCGRPKATNVAESDLGRVVCSAALWDTPCDDPLCGSCGRVKALPDDAAMGEDEGRALCFDPTCRLTTSADVRLLRAELERALTEVAAWRRRAVGGFADGPVLWAATLPFPPSVNHYWRSRRGGGRFISKAGRAFRAAVMALPSLPLGAIASRVAVRVDLWAPDRRVRDLDNFAGKALYDALVHAGVLVADDSTVVVRTLHGWAGVDKARPRCQVEVRGVES